MGGERVCRKAVLGKSCVGAFDFHLFLVTATTTSPFRIFLDA